MADCYQSSFLGECDPNSYFSFVENKWVSMYRQIVSIRCLSGSNGLWKEVTYDDANRRYVNITSATNDVSSNRVRTTSAGLTYIDCPTGFSNP